MPFPEFERLARNRPHASIDKAYPKTTDGTTASIIRKTPHRVIQQLPTGVVKSEKDDWLEIVASFIYTDKILPYANEDYALLQKCWSVVEKALTFGSCPTYSPFLERQGNFLTDLTIPYWGDIFVQPGKLSDTNSKYIFLRSWWREEDINALIDQNSQLEASAKKRKEKHQSSWDVANLKEVKGQLTQKDDKSRTPIERERSIDKEGAVEFVTGFQRGIGAKFYTFNPKTGLVLRTKANKDPRGEIPISFMYGDIDGSNPFGRGIVELVGGLQNLMDAEMQMYQYNRALMLNPPLIKRGNFNKNKIKFEPNVIIDVGSDPNADVKPLTVDSSAIANFPNNYGLMKSQLLNLLASPDTSISAEVGNPGFSKTPAGINTQNANVSVDDNYVRKMFETWFEAWSETAINLYFAERSGVEDLQLDKDTADKLRKLPDFDQTLLTPDNIIRIDYDTATPALQFVVDASTTQMKDDVKQLQGLELLQNSLDNSPALAQIVPPEKVIALWNSLVSVSGIESPEELEIDVEEFKQAQMQQAQLQQQQAQQQAQQSAQLPPEQAQLPQQPQFTPEDQQIIQVLQGLGVPEDKIGQALAMLHNGYSEQEIIQIITGGPNGQ